MLEETRRDVPPGTPRSPIADVYCAAAGRARLPICTTAVFLADRLGKPLLVEGPAGDRQRPSWRAPWREPLDPGAAAVLRASTRLAPCMSGTTLSRSCVSRPPGRLGGHQNRRVQRERVPCCGVRC